MPEGGVRFEKAPEMREIHPQSTLTQESLHIKTQALTLTPQSYLPPPELIPPLP